MTLLRTAVFRVSCFLVTETQVLPSARVEILYHLSFTPHPCPLCPSVQAPPRDSLKINFLHSLCWLIPSEVLTLSFILIVFFNLQSFHVSKAHLADFLVYLFSHLFFCSSHLRIRIIEIQHRKEFTAGELRGTGYIQHM